MEIVEQILSLVALLIIGTTFPFFLYLKYIRNQQKSTKKTVKSQIETFAAEQTREIQELYQKKITMLQEMNMELTKTNKSLQKAVNRYKGIYPDKEDTSEDDDSNLIGEEYELVPEKAIEYARKFNLNPAALNNPALSGIVWEKIKENKDMAILLGIIRPKSGLANTFAPQSAAPTNSLENLYAELQKNNQLA